MLEIKSSEIKKYFDKSELVNLTKKQIIKDFELFGEDVKLDESTDYQNIHKQVVDIVQLLSSTNNEKLMSILYQIDIAEKDLATTSEDFPEYNHYEVLAHQIIFRELKKVLLRKFYQP